MTAGGHVTAPEVEIDREDDDLAYADGIGRRTMQLLRPWRWQLVGVSVVVLLQAAMMTVGPALVSYGIDEGVAKGDTDVVTTASIVFVVTVIAAYFFGRAAIFGISKIGEAFLLDLRTRVFRHIMQMSMGYFDRTRTGVLVSRMTADVEALQDLISQGLAVFVVSAVLVVGTLVAMVLLSWSSRDRRARARAAARLGDDRLPPGVEPGIPAGA